MNSHQNITETITENIVQIEKVQKYSCWHVLSIATSQTKYSNNTHPFLKKQVSTSTFSQDLHICISLFDPTKTATLVVFCPCGTAARPVIKSKDLFGKMQKYIFF